MKFYSFPGRTALATGVALALGLPMSSADVFTVNNSSDDVNTPGSLRWAINEANNNNNPAEIDRIDFDGVSRISAASFYSISESLLINGPGAAQLTIDNAGGNTSLFEVDNGTLAIDFEISATTLHRVNNSDSSLIRHASSLGGVLRLSGTEAIADKTDRSITATDADVIIENSTINRFTGHIGGASMVITNGNLSLRDSVISNNTNVFNSGGAIEVRNNSTATHTIDIERSSFTDNSTSGNPSYGGGALRVVNTAAGGRTNVSIEDSTMAGNNGGRAGAIFLVPSSGAIQTLNIVGSVFSENTADYGGVIGLDTDAGSNTSVTITIDNSTFSNNSADTDGGVFDLRISAPTGNPSVADMVISNSTFSGNSAGSNGGMLRGFMIADGQTNISLVNTTISGNSAGTGDGGAIHILNDVGATTNIDMLHTTVTANTANTGSGGAVFATANTALTLVNSIVAGNSASSNGEINSADAVNANFSLVGDQPGKSSGVTLSSGTGGLITDMDPLFGALADNGGPTLTHALGDNSPAIATADVTAGGSSSTMPANDQRGDGFPRVRDGSPDLGAVEHIESSSSEGSSSGGGLFGWSMLLFGLPGFCWRRLRNIR